MARRKPERDPFERPPDGKWSDGRHVIKVWTDEDGNLIGESFGFIEPRPPKGRRRLR